MLFCQKIMKKTTFLGVEGHLCSCYSFIFTLSNDMKIISIFNDEVTEFPVHIYTQFALFLNFYLLNI